MKTPQPLNRQATEDFKAIYRKQFGQDLSDGEAQEMGLRLLRLLNILILPERPYGAAGAD